MSPRQLAPSFPILPLLRTRRGNTSIGRSVSLGLETCAIAEDASDVADIKSRHRRTTESSPALALLNDMHHPSATQWSTSTVEVRVISAARRDVPAPTLPGGENREQLVICVDIDTGWHELYILQSSCRARPRTVLRTRRCLHAMACARNDVLPMHILAVRCRKSSHSKNRAESHLTSPLFHSWLRFPVRASFSAFPHAARHDHLFYRVAIAHHVFVHVTPTMTTPAVT